MEKISGIVKLSNSGEMRIGNVQGLMIFTNVDGSDHRLTFHTDLTSVPIHNEYVSIPRSPLLRLPQNTIFCHRD